MAFGSAGLVSQLDFRFDSGLLWFCLVSQDVYYIGEAVHLPGWERSVWTEPNHGLTDWGLVSARVWWICGSG